MSANERRTAAQNRLFHGPILDAFARHYRIPTTDAKAILCLWFLPRRVTVDGVTHTVPGSTAALTVAEMTTFLDCCLGLAVSRGISIATDYAA